MPIPKLVVTAALMVANMALTATKKIEGPRLDSTKFTGGDYGTDLHNVWATRRLQVPIFWAEDLTEVKRRRKTKGGKYNDYSYYGTWAVALAGHEIAAVRRIWFDTHLVYDLSGAGPVTPFDFGSSADIDDHVAIYLGTETQDADSRMQATVEAEFGAGSCPAYRGTAYICFKDIPLEKLGNRIPQVSVEIVGNVSNNYPHETLDTNSNTGTFCFSPDYTSIAAGTYGSFSLVDTAARATIAGPIAYSVAIEDNMSGFAFLESGNVLAVTSSAQVYSFTPSGTATLVSTMSGTPDGTIMSVMDGDGNEHWMARFFETDRFYFDGTSVDSEGLFGSPFAAGMIFADVDGDVWIVGNNNDDTTEVMLARLTGESTTVHVTGLSASTGAAPLAYHYQDSTHDHFVIGYASKLYAIDRNTGAIVATNASLDNTAGLSLNAFRAIIPGASSVWVAFEELSSADLTRIRLMDPADWGSDDRATAYDPINHALVTQNGENLIWNYLDRIDGAGVTLESICTDVAEWCGVEDYDFSDLDQAVTGWSATRGQASNMLEPLLDAYDSDIRPHDFSIEGIKRTGVATGGTLATAYFAGDPRYTVKVRQAAELPRAMLIDFADVDADQQPNTARADRPLDATGAVGERKVDMTTLALDADEARQLTDRFFRRIWNERKEISNALTAQELKLEPGDVRTLELDGETLSARCVRATFQADDKISAEWKYDHPSLALLTTTAGGAFDGRDESVVVVPVLSKGFGLDIPLLTDSDDAMVPQVYTLAAPYASGSWPGAVIYQAVDGEYSEELASVPSSSSATWGYVSAAMPYANPNLWDRGTTITVTLQTGELTGCTEAAANADPTLNLAAIGTDGRWEIVQFTTATLTTGTTYTVSGFKRGRRGTEWAAELHQAGDTFVLLDTADNQAMGLSEVGTDVSFKAITAGRTSGFPFGYSYQGQSLMPYAPTAFTAEKLANGDWQFDWIRRARVGGAWTSGSTIPLGEDTEAYDLDVGDGVTTVTKALTSPNYLWTVAQQTTDTGAEVMAGDLVAAVYQISAAVERGFAAELAA